MITQSDVIAYESTVRFFIISRKGKYSNCLQEVSYIIKSYARIELIITEFDSEDVITTSGPGGGSDSSGSSGGSGFNLSYEEYEGGLIG